MQRVQVAAEVVEAPLQEVDEQSAELEVADDAFDIRVHEQGFNFATELELVLGAHIELGEVDDRLQLPSLHFFEL